MELLLVSGEGIAVRKIGREQNKHIVIVEDGIVK